MSSERRINALHAKKNLKFGNSFKLDRNNFSTVSEWKTFCESCVLLPFRSACGVMRDIRNKMASSAKCCEHAHTKMKHQNSVCAYCHHSMGNDKDTPMNCM